MFKWPMPITNVATYNLQIVEQTVVYLIADDKEVTNNCSIRVAKSVCKKCVDAEPLEFK